MNRNRQQSGSHWLLGLGWGQRIVIALVALSGVWLLLAAVLD